MPSTPEQLQVKIDKLEVNMGRFDSIINADETTDVPVDVGTVPSMKKVVAELLGLEGAKYTLEDYAALKAVNTAAFTRAEVIEPLRYGSFAWDGSDLSAKLVNLIKTTAGIDTGTETISMRSAAATLTPKQMVSSSVSGNVISGTNTFLEQEPVYLNSGVNGTVFGTKYYIKNATPTQFSLSDTPGGAVRTLTGTTNARYVSTYLYYSATAHGLTDDLKVTPLTSINQAFANKAYYARNVAANTFHISTSVGGAPAAAYQVTSTSVAGNVYTLANHGLKDLQKVCAVHSANNAVGGTVYWVILLSANTFSIASSLANAISDTAFTLSGTTNTTFVSCDDQTIVETHDLFSGDCIVTTTTVNGLTLNTKYRVFRVNAYQFRVMLLFKDAMMGTSPINLTAATNFTLKRLTDPSEGLYVIKTGGQLDGSAGAWKRTSGALKVTDFGAQGNYAGNIDDAEFFHDAGRAGVWLKQGIFVPPLEYGFASPWGNANNEDKINDGVFRADFGFKFKALDRNITKFRLLSTFPDNKAMISVDANADAYNSSPSHADRGIGGSTFENIGFYGRGNSTGINNRMIDIRGGWGFALREVDMFSFSGDCLVVTSAVPAVGDPTFDVPYDDTDTTAFMELYGIRAGNNGGRILRCVDTRLVHLWVDRYEIRNCAKSAFEGAFVSATFGKGSIALSGVGVNGTAPAAGLLSADITNVQTSFDITNISRYPTIGTDDFFHIIVNNGTNIEVMKVTGVSGSTVTVVRGQFNTTAVAFAAANSFVSLCGGGILLYHSDTGSICRNVNIIGSSFESNFQFEVFAAQCHGLGIHGGVPVTYQPAGTEATYIPYKAGFVIGHDCKAFDLRPGYAPGQSQATGVTPYLAPWIRVLKNAGSGFIRPTYYVSPGSAGPQIKIDNEYQGRLKIEGQDTATTLNVDTGGVLTRNVWVDDVPIAPLTTDFTQAVNPPSLAAGAVDTIRTISAAGAALGDIVEISFDLDLQGVTLAAWVSVAGTISYQFQNNTAGVIDLGSGNVKARLKK